MPSSHPAVRILRHTTPGGGWWELAQRAPRPELRPYIHDFCGYAECSPGPMLRPEFTVPYVVVIFEFGPPIRVAAEADPARWRRYAGGGFVAGLGDTPSLTEHDGFQEGMQLNLTPIGARLFFDRPACELSGQIVSLADLLGAADRALSERLQALPGWPARFALLERVVGLRIEAARAGADTAFAAIAWAAQRLAASGGTLPIADLARATGYGSQHLTELFRRHVGITPKLWSRMLRFNRLAEHIEAGGSEDWAELALRFGYYDQPHLARDVRQFAGLSPSALRALRQADSLSVAGAVALPQG
jgi:AraC-like DNA-binding protein